MKKLLLLLFACVCFSAHAVDLKQCRIVVSDQDAALVKKMANVLSEDIERVTGVRPNVNLNPTLTIRRKVQRLF